MFKHLLRWLMFGTTMFLAAAADPLAGADTAAADPSVDAGVDAEVDAGSDADLGVDEATEHEDDLADALDADGEAQDAERVAKEQDPDAVGFKGLVSRRILALKKEAPELTEVFKNHPKVQEQIEAAFRRDMGYRELGTIADFRAFREEFPGGLPDVQALREEVVQLEQVDRSFYGRDTQGNYTGHTQLIQNMYNDDRAATVSLFRTLPKEWARLDPESYNEVMGNIVGATLMRSEIPEMLTELCNAAKEAKQDGIATSLQRLQRWSQGFLKQKTAPTEEERRIEGQREQFRRESTEREKQDFTRFKTTFFNESGKLQLQIIRKHPAVAEMLAAKSVPETKKNEMVKAIQTKIQEHLRNSRAFMGKLRPAYNSSNLEECLKLQKAQWSYPWILNKFVRAVMAAETPTLVRQNRERARGAAPGSQRQPVRGRQNDNNRERPRTEPYKEGNVWYSKDGRRLTMAEIMRGAVPAHLLDAR